MIAQNLVVDTLVLNLFYEQLDEKLSSIGGRDVAMLTEFMLAWNKDVSRWLDSVLKTVASESEENRALLEVWCRDWRQKTLDAMSPLVTALLDDAALSKADALLESRLLKIGICH